MCHGGSGGSGCVIIKAQYTVSDSFAATGGTNQPNGIVLVRTPIMFLLMMAISSYLQDQNLLTS